MKWVEFSGNVEPELTAIEDLIPATPVVIKDDNQTNWHRLNGCDICGTTE